MIRILTLAATASFAAAPAIAEEATASPSSSEASVAARAMLSATSDALQARQHLVRQGYINVSSLEKDALGRWTGTASKNGKTVYVAIKLPVVPAAVSTN